MRRACARSPIGMHHADWAPAEEGELRSELVTALRDDTGAVLVAGFLGGSEHDGTFRVRTARDGSDGVELWIEAFLGGAVLQPGERRELHAVWFADGEGDPSPLLEDWAAELGRAADARTDGAVPGGLVLLVPLLPRRHRGATCAPTWPWPPTGPSTCSSSTTASSPPSATGSPRTTKFPSRARRAGRPPSPPRGARPGIWIAPFLAGADSAVAPRAPRVARHPPAPAARRSSAWSTTPGAAPVHTLDTTQPEVLDHLEAVARSLVDAGYPYLKLDFTYAPSIHGGYADPGRTPAQRVRAGFDAIRRGAGDDAFLLGCGAPIGPAVGVVDGMRIGADVAPWWHPQPDQYRPPGHTGGEPATVNAWRNTLSRSFLHRRLWLNDPDCLMLRTDHTELEPEQMRAWALAVGVSGGMALVSDDLALLGDDARALLDEVVALGREADAGAAPAPLRRPARPRPADAARDREPSSWSATRRAGVAHVQGLLT